MKHTLMVATCDDCYYFHDFVCNDILYIALVLFSYITSQFESNMTLIDPRVWKGLSHTCHYFHGFVGNDSDYIALDLNHSR